MISVTTIKALQNKSYTFGLCCISYNRWGEANLDWRVQIGNQMN